MSDLGEALAFHRRAGRKIEYLSIGWTALESLVGIIAGALAASVALISFGIDSVIEVASSLVLVWRLSDASAAEDREEFAHRWVGACFLALAVYVSFKALKDLVTHLPLRVSYLESFMPPLVSSSCRCWRARNVALREIFKVTRCMPILTRAIFAPI